MAAQSRVARDRRQGGHHGREVIASLLGAGARRTSLRRSRTLASSRPRVALLRGLGTLGASALDVSLLLGRQLHAVGSPVSRTGHRSQLRRWLPLLAEARALRAQG